jgi:hypothetical protein
MGVIDSIDFAGMSDTDDLRQPSPESGKTKSARTPFKNKMTKRFGSKYRDPDNTKTLMGEHIPLGKAYGIMTVCMFGPACRPKSTGVWIDWSVGRMQPSTP